MTEKEVEPLIAWLCTLKGVGYNDKRDVISVEFRSTHSREPIWRRLTIPMKPDQAWALVATLTDILERAGIPKPPGAVVTETRRKPH